MPALAVEKSVIVKSALVSSSKGEPLKSHCSVVPLPDNVVALSVLLWPGDNVTVAGGRETMRGARSMTRLSVLPAENELMFVRLAGIVVCPEVDNPHATSVPSAR